MTAVTRLVTVVDIDDPAPSGPHLADRPVGPEPGWAPAPARAHPADPHVMSLSALHLAELDDARRVTLLADRGWTESGPGDIWDQTSIAEIAAQARVVVGPDEPYGSYSAQDMATGHWEHLVVVLERQSVHATARELAHLPHAVELTERLRRRLRA